MGTITARGLEEHVRVSLIFVIIISFMLFTVFTLVSGYFICDISEIIYQVLHMQRLLN